MSFSSVFVVSIVAGFLGAVTGLGGGVVLIPILTACGVEIKQAIAASIVSVISVSIGAAPRYLREHLTNLKVSAFLELFAVLGALLGASITILSGRRVLFSLCGALLLASSAIVLRSHPPREETGAGSPEGSPLDLTGSYYDQVERRTIAYRVQHLSWGGLCMFGVGIIAGLVGIGSSAFTVLVHDLALGLPLKVSIATSHLIIGVMALAGASAYLEAGLLDPNLVAPVVLGVLFGAWVGSKCLSRMTNRLIRRLILVVLIALGIEMLLQGLRTS